MHSYHVRFIRDGETEPQVVRFRASSIASAFDRCLRKFPQAKLIEGRVEGSYKDGCGITIYAPPSTVTIVARTAAKEEQPVFGFFEKISLSQKETGLRCDDANSGT
jgi:hypothetical protein